MPFGHFRALHVARFTILRANTNDDIRQHGVNPTAWPSSLVFMGDVDGDSQLFLAELCIRAGKGLSRIFAHCREFDPAATIKIPRQRFDSEAQFAFTRELTINPWHCLHEHRPLGNQSRARRRMYYELSRLRMQMNDTQHIEPTGEERFD